MCAKECAIVSVKQGRKGRPWQWEFHLTRVLFNLIPILQGRDYGYIMFCSLGGGRERERAQRKEKCFLDPMGYSLTGLTMSVISTWGSAREGLNWPLTVPLTWAAGLKFCPQQGERKLPSTTPRALLVLPTSMLPLFWFQRRATLFFKERGSSSWSRQNSGLWGLLVLAAERAWYAPALRGSLQKQQERLCFVLPSSRPVLLSCSWTAVSLGRFKKSYCPGSSQAWDCSASV